jgi:hypothetical protein
MELSDCRCAGPDEQEELVLLNRDPRSSRRRLALAEKSTECIAQSGSFLILSLPNAPDGIG